MKAKRVKKIRGKKRAVSPVVATVLLILLVVILAIIILLWSRGYLKERILKFDDPIETSCSKIDIKTFVNNDNSFGFTNNGNIPIYEVDVKISGSGSSKTIRVTDTTAVAQSQILLYPDGDPSEGDPIIIGLDDKRITIIPILLGKNNDGIAKPVTCSERNSVLVWEA